MYYYSFVFISKSQLSVEQAGRPLGRGTRVARIPASSSSAVCVWGDGRSSGQRTARVSDAHIFSVSRAFNSLSCAPVEGTIEHFGSGL